MRLVEPARQRIVAWAVASQQQARRNALVASTALAELRAERLAADEAIARAVERSRPAARQPVRPAQADGNLAHVPAPRPAADDVAAAPSAHA